MEKTIKNLKEEQKSLALEIKNNKNNIKEKQRSGNYAGNQQYTLLKQKQEYRHKHIAYCMLRGRSYEQIENKCRKGNEPNFDIIKRYMDEYSKKDVCVGS